MRDREVKRKMRLQLRKGHNADVDMEGASSEDEYDDKGDQEYREQIGISKEKSDIFSRVRGKGGKRLIMIVN